jgi:hypothetical protein
MMTKMNRIYGTEGRNVPFLGEVLEESPPEPEIALGATILTAALADCGLVKKAMVGRGVQKKGQRGVQ